MHYFPIVLVKQMSHGCAYTYENSSLLEKLKGWRRGGGGGQLGKSLSVREGGGEGSAFYFLSAKFESKSFMWSIHTGCVCFFLRGCYVWCPFFLISCIPVLTTSQSFVQNMWEGKRKIQGFFCD